MTRSGRRAQPAGALGATDVACRDTGSAAVRPRSLFDGGRPSPPQRVLRERSVEDRALALLPGRWYLWTGRVDRAGRRGAGGRGGHPRDGSAVQGIGDMRISVFTDEVCPDAPEHALGLATQWGLTHVEVRMLSGGRFPAVADSEMERFSAQLKRTGLAVSGVSPGFFKCSCDDPSIDHVLSDELPRACEWARRLGTDMVTCFGFRRDRSGRAPSRVIDLLSEMSAITRRSGCRLALENEAECWGATGVEAASMIRQIDAEHISLCWDPGNAVRAGSACPYPDEYADIRELVSHVHMKSFNPSTGSWCLMSEGVVDWPGQLGALSDDGYDGFLVIETHLHVSPDEFRIVDGALSGLESNTLRNLQFVRSCLEQA